MTKVYYAKGIDFENHIKSLIDDSKLKNYAFHQLSIIKDNEKHIPDHIIILPHKVVIIEDKLKDADDIKIFNRYDAIKLNGFHSNKVFDSVVQQTLRYKKVINEILKEANTTVEIKPHLPFSLFRENKGTVTINEMTLEHLNFTVEVLGCVKSDSITSYQTYLPLHTEESIKLYIKVLETELGFFEPAMVDTLYKDKVNLLFKYATPREGKKVRMDSILDF